MVWPRSSFGLRRKIFAFAGAWWTILVVKLHADHHHERRPTRRTSLRRDLSAKDAIIWFPWVTMKRITRWRFLSHEMEMKARHLRTGYDGQAPFVTNQQRHHHPEWLLPLLEFWCPCWSRRATTTSTTRTNSRSRARHRGAHTSWAGQHCAHPIVDQLIERLTGARGGTGGPRAWRDLTTSCWTRISNWTCSTRSSSSTWSSSCGFTGASASKQSWTSRWTSQGVCDIWGGEAMGISGNSPR